jgi:hypothetical protein
LFVGILRRRQTDPESERVFRIDPDVVILNRKEAAQHQPGADKEGKGERHFGDDEAVANTLTFRATHSGTAAFLERINQFRLRGLPRRN